MKIDRSRVAGFSELNLICEHTGWSRVSLTDALFMIANEVWVGIPSSYKL